MKTLLQAMAVVFLFGGCSASTYYITEGGKTHNPVPVEKIRVYANENIKTKYSVIGSIAADTVGDADKALKLLKEKAAFLGANAIINTRLTKMHSFSSRTGISGVAVRVAN